MNYLSHGVCFLDNPWFLAGTALPDWLSVANRNVRVRPRLLDPYVNDPTPELAAFSQGVYQHFKDDDQFHQSRAFYEVTSQMTQLFKKTLGQDDGFRPSFLGHIVTELLLDRWLMLTHPTLLDQYYKLLDEIDPGQIQSYTNLITSKDADRLAEFIHMFRVIRFLYDYQEIPALLTRINQVMLRVKLPVLEQKCEQTLTEGYELIQNKALDLLAFQPTSFIVKLPTT